MTLDILALSAPLSEDDPSGPDFYGNLDRQRIEQAFDRSVSTDSSASNSASEWQDTIDLIVTQAAQTRDLWLPVYLMRAAAQSGQFDLVVQGAQLLAALMENRWADVHPKIEDVGFIGRKTACESLVRVGDFLAPLDRLPLIVHQRLGGFSAIDLARFSEKRSKAERFPDFKQALEALGPRHIEDLLVTLDSFATAIKAIDATLTANADGDTATNFTPVHEALGRMRKHLALWLPAGAEPAQDSSQQPTNEPTSSHAAAPSGPNIGFSGAVRNRNDVERAIDAICHYYSDYEPSSPVPLALRRAKEWISLDFLEVLEDIAPGSLDEALKVLKTASTEKRHRTDDDNRADDYDGEDNDDSHEQDDGWG